MDTLRSIIDEEFKIEIIKRTNNRVAVSARKIFSKILYENGYTMNEIGKYLKKDPSSIFYYMTDVDYMIEYTEGMSEKYLNCNKLFTNIIQEKVINEHENINDLKNRINELLLERKEFRKELNKYKRIKKIMNLIDCNTPVGKENFIYEKINLMFKESIEYGELPEEGERSGGAYFF
jgi:predicted transcriptional regulator